MFKRFTEKARRIIFFARYEASLWGSPFIETEHLLLALLREDHRLLAAVAGSLAPFDNLRDEIEKNTLIRQKVSTSVNLPLSNESKRVLAYAAEEADRLGHGQIGSEHLLLGLLREAGCFAAQLLNERGITLERAREAVAKLSPPGITARIKPGIRIASPVQHTVTIHGGKHDMAYILPLVQGLRVFHWEKAEVKPRDVLVNKKSGALWFYTGQQYDPGLWELKPGGAADDRCRICRWILRSGSDPGHAVAYTNGRDWICGECHDKFMGPFTPPAEDYT